MSEGMKSKQFPNCPKSHRAEPGVFTACCGSRGKNVEPCVGMMPSR